MQGIIGRVCHYIGTTIINKEFLRDHVLVFGKIPFNVSARHFLRHTNGRPLRKTQKKFEYIQKPYRNAGLGSLGHFSTTPGVITDNIIMLYLERHTHKNGLVPPESYRRAPTNHSARSK